jgi:PAT family beta-lactamase induction signal transducer AmpG
MSALGFASGLPYAIANETSSALLAELKIDRSTIGLLGAIGVIYSFKFLWSPLIDARAAHGLERLGRRRSWLLVTQLPLAALIACLGIVAPSTATSPLTLFAALLVAIAFLSATLDIVVNAWTIDSFSTPELGIGSSMSVTGYRIALLAGGTAALHLATSFGWPFAFMAMGVAMAIGVAATILSREPNVEVGPSTGGMQSLLEPLRELFVRLGTGSIIVAAMVLLFRLPDQLGGVMQKSLLLDTLGYDRVQYGYVRNGIGLAATIVGSLAGGAIVARFGIFRTLLLAAVLQAASNLGFAWIAVAIQPLGKEVVPWLSQPILALFAVSGFENICGGAVATAFVAWLMSLCDRRHAATQYAILSGAMAFAGGIATGTSGYIANGLGWPAFFAFTAAAGIPGIAIAAATRYVRTRES